MEEGGKIKLAKEVNLRLWQLLLTNVCLGRQVKNHIDVFCVENVIHQPWVTHIPLSEEGRFGNIQFWRNFGFQGKDRRVSGWVFWLRWLIVRLLSKPWGSHECEQLSLWWRCNLLCLPRSPDSLGCSSNPAGRDQSNSEACWYYSTYRIPQPQLMMYA